MRLRLREMVLELERGRPLIMGIVNAGPDSFSDSPAPKTLGQMVRRAHALVEAGAAIVDVGGQSGRTDRTACTVEEEVAVVVPLVERLAGEGLVVSVDTWRAAPARAALLAGAVMVNDVSGLADPRLAELCAEVGAGLVITHTRIPPKTKGFPHYGDVVADVLEFLAERSSVARECGVGGAQILLDPGIDLAKTPAESVELLRRLPELDVLGRPLLLAISRKDFVGALTGRPPRERDPGTLAAVEPALEAAGAMLRVHDVSGAVDFLTVRAALRGDIEAPAGVLEESLRREGVS